MGGGEQRRPVKEMLYDPEGGERRGFRFVCLSVNHQQRWSGLAGLDLDGGQFCDALLLSFNRGQSSALNVRVSSVRVVVASSVL